MVICKQFLPCYPIFISQQYSLNLLWTILQTLWYVKDLEPAESGQGMIISCFFQIKNYELQKKKLPKVCFKTSCRKWFLTLCELWDSSIQHVMKGKSLHGCRIMGINKNKCGIWNACGIEKKNHIKSLKKKMKTINIFFLMGRHAIWLRRPLGQNLLEDV